jgi:hypothetical protein
MRSGTSLWHCFFVHDFLATVSRSIGICLVSSTYFIPYAMNKVIWNFYPWKFVLSNFLTFLVDISSIIVFRFPIFLYTQRFQFKYSNKIVSSSLFCYAIFSFFSSFSRHQPRNSRT